MSPLTADQHIIWTRLWELLIPGVAAEINAGLSLTYITALHEPKAHVHALQHTLLGHLVHVKHNPDAWTSDDHLRAFPDLGNDTAVVVFSWLASTDLTISWNDRISKTEIRNALWRHPQNVDQHGSALEIQQLLTALSWWLLHPEQTNHPRIQDSPDEIHAAMAAHAEHYLSLVA